MVVLEVDPPRPGAEDEALDAAVRALAAGQLVVFPTETVYAIAARPEDHGATRRLFNAKLRPPGLNLPVLAPSIEGAWEVAATDPRAEALAATFWPGPLTLVLPRTTRSRPWYLGEREATAGVRVPDHALTRALLEAQTPDRACATIRARSGFIGQRMSLAVCGRSQSSAIAPSYWIGRVGS